MTALVAKIGGSLWRSPLLGEWIAALRAYPGPLTIVPGGGPFADAVREAQGPMGFSDAAAHEMALLAMEQYGLALAGRFAGLALAATPAEAETLRAKGATPVWRPREMALASDIAASWDVTSDSLAAWYAHASGARRLLLVKSVDLGAAAQAPDLVDPFFPAYAEGLEVWIAGPGCSTDAANILARGEVPGAAWRPAHTSLTQSLGM